MKTVRLITLLTVFILIFSAWTPSPVFARTAVATAAIGANGVSANVDVVTAKLVKLTIINQTPGTLFVTLTGHKSYFFVVTYKGKAKHEIEAGNYTYTVSSSSCLGTLTKTINFKNDGFIGPIVCRKNLQTFPW